MRKVRFYNNEYKLSGEEEFSTLHEAVTYAEYMHRVSGYTLIEVINIDNEIYCQYEN